MYARGSNRFQTFISRFADIASAVQEYLTDHPVQVDLSGYVQKETGKSLVADTEIAKIHEAGSDNQDLSGLAPLNHSHDYEPANANIQSHVSSAHAPATAQKNSDITKAEIEAKLTGEISTHTHAGGDGADPWTVVKLDADFVTSLSTNAVVTGFNFTPAANKTYLVFGYFLLRTATATVGACPGVSWPSGLTDATMRIEAAKSLTVSALRLFGAKTTQKAASTGLATTTDSHWGSLDGIMITASNVSGDLQVTLASETAGTNVTMKAGSILMYREI